MGVPRLDQLADLPKPIGVRRRLSIGVGEEPIDGSEPPHAHVRRHVEGAGAIRLIRGLQAVPPVVVDGPPLLRRHEESDPEESDQLAKGDGRPRSVRTRFFNGRARLRKENGREPHCRT